MKKFHILLFAWLFVFAAAIKADCSAFPVDIFLSGLDPRFNLSVADAVTSIQTATDYFNQNIGRPVVRQAYNGVPISFEWNDVSMANAAIMQAEQELKLSLSQIEALKKKLTEMLTAKQSSEDISAITKQINQLVSNYNSAATTVNNLRYQTNNEALGAFSRISTYATIKIFGYDSQTTLLHVIMHEIGHMQGLWHSADGNVMDARTNTSLQLSDYDAAKLRAEYDSVCR